MVYWCSFENVAEFYNATFIFDGKFEDVVFKSDVTFLKATFNSQGLFKNVNFFGDANFMAATFQILGLFEEARFHLSAPNFRGCQIDCTRLEFSGQNYFPVYESNSIAVKNYSFLKRLSDEHGQTDQALNFNALELRVKAKQSKEGFWFKIFTRAYEIISDFGRSFAKPLKYYLGLLLVVYILALGNAVVNSPKDCKAENLRMLSDLWRDDTPCDISKTNPDDKTRLNGYRAAAEYTVYRAAGILDFSDNGKGTDAVARRLFGQSYEPGWMRFVGLVKAIASTALLFLAALGLRNKYRIK